MEDHAALQAALDEMHRLAPELVPEPAAARSTALLMEEVARVGAAMKAQYEAWQGAGKEKA